jgi:parallel beta-helix repeat protein
MQTISVRILKITGFLTITLNLIALSLVPLQTAKSTDPSLLTCFLVTTPNGKTIQSFGTIQEAINTAENGSTIQVPSGTYYEHVIINKTISLIGENASTTIVDGNDNGTVVQVTTNNVNISGFTLQNSGWGWYRSGIETQNVSNCRLENNILFHTCHSIRLNFSRNCLVTNNIIDHTNQMGYGVRITESVNCTISYNFVAKNIGGIVFENSSDCTAINNNVTRNSDGIRLYSSSSNNKISGNNVFNNSYCGMIYPVPSMPPPLGNAVFHNNFVGNNKSFIIQSGGNAWDNGVEGNCWTDYVGADLDHNGIGDTPHSLEMGKDRYPLMGPFSEFSFQSNEKTYTAATVCNSNITNFSFETASNESKIEFDVNSTTNVTGFCRIAVPTELMNRPFTVLVDDNVGSNATLKALQEASSLTRTSLYFSYTPGPHKIVLVSGFVPSSFWDAFLIPILLVGSAIGACLVIIVFRRKLRARHAS